MTMLLDTIQTAAPPKSRRAAPLLVPKGPSVERILRDRIKARSNVRLMLGTVVGFAAVFLAGDLILSRIPLPAVYGSRNHAIEKLTLLDSLPVTPDAAFLGCSYQWNAIRPHVVDEVVAARIGRNIVSANIAASSASGWTQWLMVRRMVESGRVPKVVYLDVGPIALQSEGRSYLINGLRALGEWRDVTDAAGVSFDVLGESVAAAALASFHRWEDVNMMTHKVILGAPLVPHLKLVTDDRGWGEWRGRQHLPEDTTTANLDWAAGAVEKISTHVGGGSAADNLHVKALGRAIDLLQGRGVAVRLLEMPVASVADPRISPQGNAAYLDLVAVLEAEHSIPILRVPPDLVSDSDFYDAGHLNPSGAAKFSRWLAGDVAKTLHPLLSVAQTPN